MVVDQQEGLPGGQVEVVLEDQLVPALRDLLADVERAVSLGAHKLASFDEYGIEWTTLKDPEGNVFDIGRRKLD